MAIGTKKLGCRNLEKQVRKIFFLLTYFFFYFQVQKTALKHVHLIMIQCVVVMETIIKMNVI